MTMHSTRSYAKTHPIRIGLFVVLGVLALGAGSAFTLGYATPVPAEAQVTLTGVTVTAATTAATSASTVAASVAATVSSVVTSTIAAVTTTVSEVVVPGHTPAAKSTGNNAPSVTDSSGHTTVSEVVVTALTPDSTNSNPTTEPCCGGAPSTPTTLIAATPAPLTAAPVNTNPFTLPCCTIPSTPSTPSITPVITTPIIPVVVDICVNIDGLQTTVPSGMVRDNAGNCTTPPPNAPLCTLYASTSAVTVGSSVTLSWTTQNAASGSINHGVGNATPIAAGSRTAVVTGNTLYTLTVIGNNGQTVSCAAPVIVTTIVVPPGPICTLSASAGTVARGSSVDLVWTTTRVATASIDNGVGNLNPVAGGTKSVVVNADTIYTLTGVGTDGTPVTCSAPVKITTGGGGSSPICTLTATPASVQNGGTASLTYGGTNIVSVFIDNGVGTTTGVSGSTNVVVNGVGTHTYTGTFRTTSGTDLTCTASVIVIGGGGGCTSNCGGGGGGSGPRVVLSQLQLPGDQPLSFVYLSQIPYTGLDLGPWGTAMYWIMLILWSLAAAYLVLFTGLPFVQARARSFGTNVKQALNQPAIAPTSHAPVMHSQHAPQGHGHTAHAPVHAQTARPTIHEGFRSFAAGESLTIDDIVKGLSRQVEENTQTHPLPADRFSLEEQLLTSHATVETVSHPEVVFEAPVSAPVAAPRVEASAAPVSTDVRSFLSALIAGDRDAVFGTVRGITREGGDSEAFLTHAVCALDDAYRARLDGSSVHPDIAELTAHCHPSFLERLVSSLTTAVDGSYSTGVTGVKLALTRALAVVNG